MILDKSVEATKKPTRTKETFDSLLMAKRSLERSRSNSAQAKTGDGEIALIAPHRATLFRGTLVPVSDNIGIVGSVEAQVLVVIEYTLPDCSYKGAALALLGSRWSAERDLNEGAKG